VGGKDSITRQRSKKEIPLDQSIHQFCSPLLPGGFFFVHAM
jgi:hypothetical protein